MRETTIIFDLGKEIGEAAGSVVDAFADGKVSLVEGLEMGKELGTLALCAYKNRGIIGSNFRDGISEAEESELGSGFKVGFDVENDLAEEQVETYCSIALDVVGDLSRLFLESKKTD